MELELELKLGSWSWSWGGVGGWAELDGVGVGVGARGGKVVGVWRSSGWGGARVGCGLEWGGDPRLSCRACTHSRRLDKRSPNNQQETRNPGAEGGFLRACLA